eukprot:13327503-Heterocapsa_arctica.AAC.1
MCVKQELRLLCDNEHEHQTVMGSNAYGPRSIQKATWPEVMCKQIIKAILMERAWTSAYALPAE